MSHREHFSVGLMVACVAGLIFMLGFLVHQSLGAKQWRSSFNDEMAQRLDLEEKITRIEKERSVLMADAKDLSAQLERTKAEAEDLKSAFVLEREEKKSLQARLDQVQTPVLISTTK